MKHKYLTPGECNCEGFSNCNICDGGLAYCKVCKGAEGSLPTECPGTPMDEMTQDAVYAETLDFIGGYWINKGVI